MLKYPLIIEDLSTRNPIVAVSNIMNCFRLLCVHYTINLITYSVRAYIFSLYFQRGPSNDHLYLLHHGGVDSEEETTTGSASFRNYSPEVNDDCHHDMPLLYDSNHAYYCLLFLFMLL